MTAAYRANSSVTLIMAVQCRGFLYGVDRDQVFPTRNVASSLYAAMIQIRGPKNSRSINSFSAHRSDAELCPILDALESPLIDYGVVDTVSGHGPRYPCGIQEGIDTSESIASGCSTLIEESRSTQKNHHNHLARLSWMIVSRKSSNTLDRTIVFLQVHHVNTKSPRYQTSTPRWRIHQINRQEYPKNNQTAFSKTK